MQYNAIQWNTIQFNVIKNRYTSLIAKEKMVKDSLVGAENTMTDLWWMFRQPVHWIPSNGLSPCDCVVKCQSLCRDSNPKQTFLSRSLFHLRHSTKNYIDLLHLGGGLALPTLAYNYHFPVFVEPYKGFYVRLWYFIPCVYVCLSGHLLKNAVIVYKENVDRYWVKSQPEVDRFKELEIVLGRPGREVQWRNSQSLPRWALDRFHFWKLLSSILK